MTSNVKLLPCPFCGGQATLTLTGNVHSTRKCMVKCGECRYQRIDAALRYGDDWLRAKAIKAWNTRACVSSATEALRTERDLFRAETITLVRQNGELQARAERLAEALRIAEAALADIGDADREPGDDLAWCERRAAEPLPMIRALLRDHEQEVGDGR